MNIEPSHKRPGAKGKIEKVNERPATFFPDLPATEDCLDFKPYAETLAELIASEDTSTPLTVGIFGAWGAGKTSLMGMIEGYLKKIEKETRTNRFVLIRFDAWKYYKEDALWRAMLLRVLERMRAETGTKEDPDIARLEQVLYRDIEWEEKSGLTVDWPKLISAGAGGALKLSLAFVPGLSILSKAVDVAQSKLGKDDFSDLADAFKRSVVTHHQTQLLDIEQFQQQFASLVKKHFRKKRLVIFVDDLDRCLPEKAIEVLEAIKLFLDVEGCVFVLGIDQQVIMRGIESKYRDLAASPDYLPVVSSHYIEKIIQLPFQLPPIESGDMRSFVAKLNADWPDTDCVQIFAEGLPPNPRQVKRAINVFMLLWKLAEKRKTKLGEAVTPLRLAKVVVLQTAHPKLFDRLKSDHGLLKQLESLCREGGDGAQASSAPIDPVIQDAARHPDIKKLFQLFKEKESAHFAKLALTDLTMFFSLARRAPLMPEAAIISKDVAVETAVPERKHAQFQLRRPLDDFVGREQEILTLTNSLSGEGSIGVITGMPGTGKTELALVVADRLRAEYPDAQIFVDMRGTSETPLKPADAMADCVRVFSAPDSKPPENTDELAKLYRSTLNGKRALILLDNAVDSNQVRPLIPPKGCALLITSRNALVLSGRTAVELGVLQPDEAARLLSGIASRVPEDIVAKICRLCGYLPPALRAAGSMLEATPDLDPAHYVEQLQDERTRLQRIGTEGIDAGVEASFSLSFVSLAPETARVFTQLAVFPSSFDAAAEEAVCEDAGHRHLSELVRRSLVLYDNSTRRYNLHNLMRLFADRRLDFADREAAARRHATYYLRIVQEANSLYKQGGEGVKRGLELFNLEWSNSNIQAGFQWASERASVDNLAASLCSAYAKDGGVALDLRQQPSDRIAWREAALKAARLINDQEAEGNHLISLGLAHDRLDEIDEAIEIYNQALALAHEREDRLGEGIAVGYLAVAHRKLGFAKNDRDEVNLAIDLSEQHLQIMREFGDLRGEYFALTNLGNAYTFFGRTAEAIECHEKARDIADALKDPRVKAAVLNNLGIAYDQMGKFQDAIEMYQKQLDIARELGDELSQANAMFNMSITLIKLGKREQAVESARGALKIYEQIKPREAVKVREHLSRWMS